MNLKPITALLALGCLICLTLSCATGAGQLTAEQVYPSVDVVTTDLEQYLDAGIAPDGSQLDPDEVFQLRGNVVALRNAFLVAMGEQKEPLLTLSAGPSDGATGPPRPAQDDGAPRVR